MDFVNRLSGQGPRFNLNSALKFTELSVPVQRHLEKVYATLAATLLVSASGVYFNLVTGLGGFLSMIAFVACSVWLAVTPNEPKNLNKRYALLGGTAFAQGASLGPLIGAAMAMDSALVLTAFLGTAALFGSFSLAALMSRRRSYLYLGAGLSSAISTFAMIRLASWFFPAARSMAFSAELYGGLLVFAGYVIFDTQVIVEEAFAGNMDHIRHAMMVFVDFVAIAVRLLVILMQKEESKEKRRRRRED
mmetsp:Transcript_2856/g.8357  ORF Transcript_2856/g.8357 Transcript_2856/m.8357 type:complete len:248 (-) Transcript_2856:234-977(-)|eukprot:CAMPEP_0206134870 /NCGR_PEP_ID=MMETSP1473-20131121/274_1 /ASSEMBLY_ACC=CAM_ASM_001109 /TAXON_ID=1461547 /ORGANISM="Stichococcus sp, Strain RCC1054" /LENGTH=247 /DNA_ID=CAMNT_0053526501 /DNA_START=86 /DNA_END=829 /DNA_ORIENTATION=-